MKPAAAVSGAESSLRLAFVLALTISMAAAATLYQSNVSETPSESRRGNGSGDGQTQVVDEQRGTPTPLPTPRPRSQAVITAPEESADDPSSESPPLPSLGRYIYSVVGTEQGSFLGGGSRGYPSEMTMTVNRSTDDPSIRLRPDEVVFDLNFSTNHTESEVVAYRKDGIHFTSESWSISFGGTSFVNDGTYTPPMLQIPIPLDEGVEHTGTSRVEDPAGNESRTEEWTVEVQGPERIFALGVELDTWMVRIERRTRSGSQPVTRSRTYWLSPERSIWVKWQETTNISQGSGLTRSSYVSDYTATLDRIEPL
ncbi:MAG: hypothetical protein WD646_04680 [Actinomycetota bacterium]